MLADQTSAHALMLLAGYTKRHRVNERIKERAVGLVEARQIILGLSVEGNQVAAVVEAMLAMLADLPFEVLEAVQNAPSYVAQLEIIGDEMLKGMTAAPNMS